jgi:hypothetical protein
MQIDCCVTSNQTSCRLAPHLVWDVTDWEDSQRVPGSHLVQVKSQRDPGPTEQDQVNSNEESDHPKP